MMFLLRTIISGRSATAANRNILCLTSPRTHSTSISISISSTLARNHSSTQIQRLVTGERQKSLMFGCHQHQQQSRTFSRTSEMEPDSPELKAKNFVIQVGYTPKVAQGVVDALKESGLSGTALLETVRTMAGRWEVGEDAGLEALVESVKLHLARSEGRTPITLWCVPPNAWKSKETDQADFEDIDETPEEHEKMMSRAFPVEAQSGLSLTDVAKFGDGEGASNLGEYLECACAGIAACSTCHVVIDPEWYDKVGKPSEDEQDMLDLAYAPRSTSRLGCQIVLEENMDGMVIRIPGGANNLMDYIPFE